MTLWLKLLILLFAGLFVASSIFGLHLHSVYSGFVASTSTGEPTYSQNAREGFGKQITEELRRKDVRLAIVSRSGQARSKLPEGVAFTHSAFWLLNDDGVYDVYNLYHGEENRLISSLVVDGPAAFLRLTQEADVGILVPKLAAQDRLYSHIKSSKYGVMHQVNYSLISNPFDSRYQNCNEFMLDEMASVFWNDSVISSVKTRLEKSLKPTTLKTSWLKRKIGPKIDERLIMGDHDGPIITTTRQTLSQFLNAQDALAEDYILPLAIAD